MQNIIEWCFAVLLFTWWILSFISQVNIHVRKFFGKYIFHLIPNYRFFAPVPIRRDYHLEYRSLMPSLRVTKWSRVQLFSERTTLSVIWYPDKRLRKSFNTYVKRIIRVMAVSKTKSASKSVSYLHLVNFLLGKDEIKNSAGFQFRIVTLQTFDETSRPRLILTSDWHFPPKKSANEL